MAYQYFPENDRAFRDWLNNFVANLTINAAVVGLLPADLTQITTDADDFTVRMTTYDVQKGLLNSALGAKKTSRTAAIETLRPLVQRIQKHPGMNDQLRGLLGLPIRAMSAEPVPIEEMKPKVVLEVGTGQVAVHWGANPSNEQKNARPAGIRGGNVYRRREGDADYVMVGFATTSPYYDQITGPASDYTYVVRYRGRKSSDLSQQSDPGTVAARGEAAA